MTHSFRLSIYLDFTDSIDLYWKIHLFFCSSKKENSFHAKSEFVDNWIAIESQIDQTINFLSVFKKNFEKISCFLQKPL